MFQTDFKEEENIYNEGCLMMCLLYISEKMCGKHLNREQILHMYKHMISRGYIEKDCFVKDHAAVINESNSYLIEPYIRAKYVGAQYINEPDKSWGKNNGDYILLQVETEYVKSHFISINGYYNPYQPASKILSIISIRYYSII